MGLSCIYITKIFIILMSKRPRIKYGFFSVSETPIFSLVPVSSAICGTNVARYLLFWCFSDFPSFIEKIIRNPRTLYVNF